MRTRLLSLLPILALPACFEDCNPIDDLSLKGVNLLLVNVPDLEAEYGILSEEDDFTMAVAFVLDLLGDDGASIKGARVHLLTPSGMDVPLEEVEPGRYEARSDTSPSLTYEPQGDYTLRVITDDGTYTATAKAFVRTEILDPAHTDVVPLAQDLEVTVKQDASSTLVAVYDQEGVEQYNSFPTTSDDLVDLILRGNGSTATVPASALAAEGVSFLAAAGVRQSDWGEVSEGLSPSLSYFVSGSLDAIAVSTTPWDAMGALVYAMDGSDLESQGIFLEESVTAVAYGTRVVVGDGIESQPLTGASATLGWAGQELTLTESGEEPGQYQATSEDYPSLTYLAGYPYTMSLRTGDVTYALAMTAPEAPVLSEPAPRSYHEPGTPLNIVTPATHDRYFVAVVDGNGEVIWDDFPEDVEAQEVIDGTIGTGPGETIQIPGALFTTAGLIYGIGLLGLVEMEEGGASDNLNTNSNMFVGSTAFTSVLTVPGV